MKRLRNRQGRESAKGEQQRLATGRAQSEAYLTFHHATKEWDAGHLEAALTGFDQLLTAGGSAEDQATWEFWRGKVLAGLGRHEEALASLRRARSRTGIPGALEVHLLVRLGRVDEALEALRTMAAERPDDHVMIQVLALEEAAVLAAHDRTREAIAALDRVLPSTLSATGSREGVWIYFPHAVPLVGLLPWSHRVNLWALQAHLAAESGEVQLSTDCLATAAGMEPDLTWSLYDAAIGSGKKGDDVGAAFQFRLLVGMLDHGAPPVIRMRPAPGELWAIVDDGFDPEAGRRQETAHYLANLAKHCGNAGRADEANAAEARARRLWPEQYPAALPDRPWEFLSLPALDLDEAEEDLAHKEEWCRADDPDAFERRAAAVGFDTSEVSRGHALRHWYPYRSPTLSSFIYHHWELFDIRSGLVRSVEKDEDVRT